MRMLKPEWAYLKLETDKPCDTITWKLELDRLLDSYGGIHLQAIQLDVLKVDGERVYVRCPHASRLNVQAAIRETESRGIRVLAVASYLPMLA